MKTIAVDTFKGEFERYIGRGQRTTTTTDRRKIQVQMVIAWIAVDVGARFWRRFLVPGIIIIIIIIISIIITTIAIVVVIIIIATIVFIITIIGIIIILASTDQLAGIFEEEEEQGIMNS